MKYLQQILLMSVVGLSACTSVEEDARDMNCRELRYRVSELKNDIEEYEEDEVAYGIGSLFDDDLDDDADLAELQGDLSKDDLKVFRREMARKGCRGSRSRYDD